MRVAIVQPNYIPWIGYFDLIAAVDVFVLYDTVQYTKRDWRNRNRIKVAGGDPWLTVPVHGSSTMSIEEVSATDLDWRGGHLDKLRQNYREAACFETMMGRIERWYDEIPGTGLTDIDAHLLGAACGALGIETHILRASELGIAGERSERLLANCQHFGADTYVSGPAARDYLDTDLFRQNGIDVAWARYDYPETYPQPHPPFDRQVSILDTLLCCGDAAREQLRFDSGAFLEIDAGSG